MTIIVRYKNGTLYNKSKQEFIALEDIRRLAEDTFCVVTSGTKKDITDEVMFLADVAWVRRKELWKKARVVLE
jgi:polyhydroxyalkanoate synthesis regulator protein